MSGPPEAETVSADVDPGKEGAEIDEERWGIKYRF
jgi:hypothetical protein